jgi:hypothetical protein
MANRALAKLIDLGGNLISEDAPRMSVQCAALAGARSSELLALLWKKNGLFVFESALHILHAGNPQAPMPDICTWNESPTWRSAYHGLADGGLCFAEDLFGGQFQLSDDCIVKMDPETGNKTRIADNLEGWAQAILDDYEILTGWPLAREWQEQRGPLPLGSRLIPKLPFVLGGAFSVDNLHVVPSVVAMRFYGDLAVQLRNLPDGADVKIKIID